MNKLIFILLLLPCCLANALSEGVIYENERHIYERFLLSGHNLKIKAVAQSVFKKNIVDTKLLDLLAEVLIENVNDPKLFDERSDTIAWMAKALGRSGNNRYEPTVKNILALSGSNLRLRRHVDAALQDFSGKEQVPFSSNPDSLVNMTKSIENDKVVVKDLGDKFSTVDIGTPLEDIVRLLGSPDEIMVNPGRRDSVFGQVFGTPGMAFKYREYGIIYLTFKGKDNIGWTSNIISNVYVLMKDETDPEVLTMAELLLSDDWVGIAKMAANVARENKAYPTILYDIAMERLFQSSGVRAYREEKMLAGLCQFVGSSKNSRYEDSMISVSKTSLSRLVRKKSRHSIRKLKISHAGQSRYVKGLVDIGEQGIAAFYASQKRKKQG